MKKMTRNAIEKTFQKKKKEQQRFKKRFLELPSKLSEILSKLNEISSFLSKILWGYEWMCVCACVCVSWVCACVSLWLFNCLRRWSPISQWILTNMALIGDGGEFKASELKFGKWLLTIRGGGTKKTTNYG